MMRAIRKATEDGEHMAVAQYLDCTGALWCHVPNGGHRHLAVAAKLKRMGVKAGVPDFLVFDPPPGMPSAVGVALELKAHGGRVSKQQRGWLDDLQDRRWLAMVALGAGDAITRLRACGYLPGGRSR